MPASKLNTKDIKISLTELDCWSLEPQDLVIYKEWYFTNFKTVIIFLNQVFELADAQDHHPEVLTTHTYIKIRLRTHDSGGITQKDFTLASAIDRLISSGFDESIGH